MMKDLESGHGSYTSQDSEIIQVRTLRNQAHVGTPRGHQAHVGTPRNHQESTAIPVGTPRNQHVGTPRAQSTDVLNSQITGQDMRLPSRGSADSMSRRSSREAPMRRPSNMSTFSVHSVVEMVRHKINPMDVTVTSSFCLVAICAGMVNAISFLSLSAFVSHVTGNTSKVGVGLEAESWSAASDNALLVGCFMLGSLVCGLLIAKDTVSFGHARYGYALLGNAALLVCAMVAIDERVAACMAASACGIQNGMATSYSGAVIRTTHVTGIATDVGLLVGRLIVLCFKKHCLAPRRKMKQEEIELMDEHMREDAIKLRLLSLLFASFLIGVMIGAALHASLGREAFIVPAVITGLCGATYWVYRHLVIHHKCEPFNTISESLGKNIAPKKTSTKVEVTTPSSIKISGVEEALSARDDDMKVSSVSSTPECVTHKATPPSNQPAPLREVPSDLPLEATLALREGLANLEPHLSLLPGGPALPGSHDLRADAVEAFGRLRAIVLEAEVHRSHELGGQQATGDLAPCKVGI